MWCKPTNHHDRHPGPVVQCFDALSKNAVARKRHPYICRLSNRSALKCRWSHTDDRCWVPVQGDREANDTFQSLKLIPPESVADDGNEPLRIRAVFTICKD